MAKEKPKPPINFVDLRPAAKKESGLIQDVFHSVWDKGRQGYRQKLNKQTMLVLALIIILTIGLASISLVWQHVANNRSSIPASVRKELTFSLYYPTHLPPGYYVKPNSFQYKDGALIFYIVSAKNKEIGVSEQALPSGVTAQQAPFSPVRIPGERDFYTAAGHAHISLEGVNYVSETITNGGTWIILNVTGFSAAEATAITQSFTAIH